MKMLLSLSTGFWGPALLLAHFAKAFTHGNLTSELASLNFTVAVPGDLSYPNASIAFNQRYTFNPAAVFFPNTADDVSVVMELGRRHNFNVVARSGGHSYIANGLGGKNGSFVMDMRNFNTVTVDPTTNIAQIGPGNTLGNVALALNSFGRAMPHGTCPYVGIGGHSGHGGYGFTSRKWGLTLDTVVSLDVVLADGQQVTASADSHPDLFWGLRGASSSLGIVTQLHVDTFAAPNSTTVFKYNWDLSAEDAATAVAAFQSFVQQPDFPQEYASDIVLHPGSAMGRVSFGLLGGWYGPSEAFASVIAPFLANMSAPLSERITVGSYITSVEVLGGMGFLNTTSIPDVPTTFYAKSLMTPPDQEIPENAALAFMQYLGNEGFNANTNWFVDMELYGGTNSAINNIPSDATAFFNRKSLFTFQFYTTAPGGVPPFPPEGFELLDGMVQSILDNSPSQWKYGAYANYIDDRLSDWESRYYGDNYPRLRALKRILDPTDVINFPLAIQDGPL